MSKFSAFVVGLVVVATAAVTLPVAASAAPATRVVYVAAVDRVTTYGAATPKLGYSVSGLAAGDRLTRTPRCTVPSHHAAGVYPITCSGAAANPARYSFRYVKARLFVGRATLTVGALYQQKRYADPDPGFPYATAGLVRGDKLRTAPRCGVAGEHSAVGTYKITCSGADAGPNYVIRYLEQRYLVGRSAALVGPYDQYVTFGSPDPTFDWAVFGLKKGEKLIKAPTCGVAGEHVHAGTYEITCRGANAGGNYDLTVVHGQLTIFQAISGIKAEPFLPSGTLTATLAAAKPSLEVLPGQTLTFSTDGTPLCTAVTDAKGVASCSPGANTGTVLRNGSYDVTFAGNRDIAGSSASAGVS